MWDFYNICLTYQHITTLHWGYRQLQLLFSIKYCKKRSQSINVNFTPIVKKYSCQNSILKPIVKMMKNVICQVKLDNFIRTEMEQFGQLHYQILADFVPTTYFDVHDMGP